MAAAEARPVHLCLPARRRARALGGGLGRARRTGRHRGRPRALVVTALPRPRYREQVRSSCFANVLPSVDSSSQKRIVPALSSRSSWARTIAWAPSLCVVPTHVTDGSAPRSAVVTSIAPVLSSSTLVHERASGQ